MKDGAKLYKTYIIVGMIVAILAGIAVGLAFGKSTPQIGLGWANLHFLGSGFISLLKIIVIPLVVTSMVVGVTSLGSTAKLGRFGSTTIVYYMATTAIAVVIGLVVVNLCSPGSFIKKDTGAEKTYEKKTPAEIAQAFVPWNLVLEANGKKKINIVALIEDSILIGWLLLLMGAGARKAVRFFEICNRFILKLTVLIMLLAPFGIFGIIASNVGTKGLSSITDLWAYFLVVVFGLAVHAFVVLPLILKWLGRRDVLEYFGNVSPALSMAFATASSSATLPVTMECVEERAGVDKDSANFVLPLGATVNMDGTALYEAVAVMTIAQSLPDVHMTFVNQVVIFLTATLAAVGAAGIPHAGLFTMVIVLGAVGLDPKYIGLIIAVDWILDRFRTTVNVWGDTIGAAVISRLSGGKAAEDTGEK